MKFLDWVLRERSLTVYLVYDPFKNRQSQSMETGEGVGGAGEGTWGQGLTPAQDVPGRERMAVGGLWGAGPLLPLVRMRLTWVAHFVNIRRAAR